MRTAAVVLLLGLGGLPCLAQTAPLAPPRKTDDPNQLTPNVRLYQPKNLNEARARKVADFVNSVLGRPVKVDWDDVPGALVIRAPSPAESDAAETLLKRFDVPEHNPGREAPVASPDFVIYLVRAARGDGVSAHPPGAELQPAIDEMKRNFSYDRYGVWDTIPVEPSGAGELQGILPADPGAGLYVYSVRYSGTSFGGGILTLYNFQFSVKLPYGQDGIDSHIKTTVTLHEGQKLVLGKIRLLPAENADLFLVLATKPR